MKIHSNPPILYLESVLSAARLFQCFKMIVTYQSFKWVCGVNKGSEYIQATIYDVQCTLQEISELEEDGL